MSELDAIPGSSRFATTVFRPFFSRNANKLVPGVQPEPHELVWSQLVKTLVTFRRTKAGEKTELPAWSPTRYRPEAVRRCAENVLEVTCLVLDYDDGTPLDRALLPWSDWPCVWHSSWSHSMGLPKYRIVVPFERPIPAEDWPRVWSWAAKRSAGKPDEKCKDPSRIYFLPAEPYPDAPRLAGVHDPGGPLLEVVVDTDCPPLPAPKPPPPPPSVPEWKARRVGAELLKVDPGARARAAELLGARIVGDRAEDAMCPQCARPSVYWLLSPSSYAGAMCQHRSSCGWRGWLDQLLDRAEAA
jgi:hypothetical protein